MNHLPTDSLHHLLGFADAYDLCAAASVCREWLQIVANPSMARSELWATLAASAWHRAHRTHASLMHVKPADDLDSGAAASSAAASLPPASEAEEESQGELALARLHAPAHPPPALIAPGLPDSVGFRELFFYSTLWPHAIDCSSPAVFSTVAGDQHQMAIRPLLPVESMLASSRIAGQKEAKFMTNMLRRMGVIVSEEGAEPTAADVDLAGESDDDDAKEDDNENEDDEDDDSEGIFDEEEEVARMASLPEEEWCAGVKERFLEEILERVEQERVELAQARRLAARNRRNAGAPPARAGARVEARVVASNAAAPAPAATAAAAPGAPADATAAAPNRPGVRRRAIPNGPTPASDDTPIADAEAAGKQSESMEDDEAAEIDADALDEEDAEDDADEDAEDEEDAEEDDEEDEEDGEIWDSSSDDELPDDSGKPLSAEDAAERKELEDAMRDETDADTRVGALFTLAIEEAAPLVKLAARRNVVEDLLSSEEGMSLIKLLRTNELRRIAIEARKTAKRNAQTLANSAFDLGILASPPEASEALPANEEHLTRFAYVGLSIGGDRSVRSNVPFPTRMPDHAVPFTVVSWVSRKDYEGMLREEEAERAQRALPGFKKASEAAGASASAGDETQDGPKRKQPAGATADSAAEQDAAIYAGLSENKKQRIQAMASVFASAFTPQAAAKASSNTGATASAAAGGGLDEDEEAHGDLSASAGSFARCAYVPLVRLSFIAYYEIAIEKAPEITGTGSGAAARRRAARAAEAEQCVALGFCTSRFRLASKQPGWDRSSWGLHGDDASLFHGSGSPVGSLDSRGFGPGDIVGAGIDYRRGEIFFTRNGVYLGVGFKLPRAESLTLYVTVGIDSPNALQINFGDDRPFLFDVLGHERSKGYLSGMGRTVTANPAKSIGAASIAAAAAPAESKEMEDSVPSAAASAASASAPPTPAAAAPSPAAQLLSDYRSFLRAKREWRGKIPAAIVAANSSADASKPKM